MLQNPRPWTYYSKLVPGYIEKYGSVRGMRDRNRRLMKQLTKAGNEEETRSIRNELIENNQPLAKMYAERYGYHNGWSKEKKEDMFQECMVSVKGYIDTVQDWNIPQSYFQVRLSNYCKSAIENKRRLKIIENNDVTLPFNEDNFAQDSLSINSDFLRQLVLFIHTQQNDKEKSFTSNISDAKKWACLPKWNLNRSLHSSI